MGHHTRHAKKCTCEANHNCHLSQLKSREEGGREFVMCMLCMAFRITHLRCDFDWLADHSTGNLVGKRNEVIRFNISQILVATVVFFFLCFLLRLQVRVGSGCFLMGGTGGGGMEDGERWVDIVAIQNEKWMATMVKWKNGKINGTMSTHRERREETRQKL